MIFEFKSAPSGYIIGYLKGLEHKRAFVIRLWLGNQIEMVQNQVPHLSDQVNYLLLEHFRLFKRGRFMYTKVRFCHIKSYDQDT